MYKVMKMIQHFKNKFKILSNFFKQKHFNHNVKKLKAPKHEYIFSKYSQNLNISEIFWACYRKNNFPIIFPKYKKPDFLTSSKFKISRFKSNQFDLKRDIF